MSSPKRSRDLCGSLIVVEPNPKQRREQAPTRLTMDAPPSSRLVAREPVSPETSPEPSTTTNIIPQEQPKTGIPKSAMLRDAQLLKYKFPESQWAPNIKELDFLSRGMRVMVSIQKIPSGNGCSLRSERFWVNILHVKRQEQEVKWVIGRVEDDLQHFRLREGRKIRFETRHVCNVDDMFELSQRHERFLMESEQAKRRKKE
mmetsp:Transcript_25876/g.39658  ORF Transcript_25876/g.39658 Transcript_25876/m.39658 type:complete len:202 (+) Transcript_25876:97-702(+)